VRIRNLAPILALLAAALLPVASAHADNLVYSPSNVVSSPAGGVSNIIPHSSGLWFVHLDPGTGTLTYYFDLATTPVAQGAAPTYPVTVPFTAAPLGSPDPGVLVSIVAKTSNPCSAETYTGTTASLTYSGRNDTQTLCVKVVVPDNAALTKNVNQWTITGPSPSPPRLNVQPGILIRVMKQSVTPTGLFWISDSNWLHQESWHYTDASGQDLGPNNFAINYQRGTGRITATNPGQFYANLWLPAVTATNLVMHVEVPADFCLSADPSGVSTKVYVGASNINFADPKSQTEYTRNHSFTITVGAIATPQDVYMTVHMNYCRTNTSGLAYYPAPNPYEFWGRADTAPPRPGEPGIWPNGLAGDYANLTTAIYGILKR
jgi:hypothetical protein